MTPIVMMRKGTKTHSSRCNSSVMEESVKYCR